MRFLGRSMELGVSEDMLSRVFDGLGRPIDGGPDILPEFRRDINGLPMNPAARSYPSEVIQTGVSAIDGLNTLVRGQKLRYSLPAACPMHSWRRRLRARPRCAARMKALPWFLWPWASTFEESNFFITPLKRAAPSTGRLCL